MTDDLSDGAIWLSATLTVAQHRARPGQSYAPGTCAMCTPGDCRQLRWAEVQIARIRARFQGAAE